MPNRAMKQGGAGGPAQGLPQAVIDAYSYHFNEQNESPDRKKLLHRLVTSEIAKPAIIRLSKTILPFDWMLLFDAIIEAAFMPWADRHNALPDASILQQKIIKEAANLANSIEDYKKICFGNKVMSNFHDGIPNDFVQQLRTMSNQLAAVKLERIGIGAAAWAAREQAGDGLAQFVRYLDARLMNYRVVSRPIGARTMARLAMAALNFKNTDDDPIGKIEARVKQYRKSKQ